MTFVWDFGNRKYAQDTEEYRLLLSQFSTGQSGLNTVFLHAEMRGHASYVEDFRGTLALLALLLDGVAWGAYQRSHVWAGMLKSPNGVKRISTSDNVKVKERR